MQIEKIISIKIALTIRNKILSLSSRVKTRLDKQDNKSPRNGEAGFTLLEILVVIAILGLLIGLVAPAALRQLGGAREKVAHQSIERIGAVLDIYKLDVGTYPTSEQGLQALIEKPSDVVGWDGPYVKGDKIPVDPWTHPYTYRSPSNRHGHDYDLCSAGASGQSADSDEHEQTSSSTICNP